MIGDYVFRMTHIDNIPHILQNGITHRNSPNANPNYTVIGDISLIGVRANKIIPVSNGMSGYRYVENICLGDFIPFYFWWRMPMLYIIQNGFNVVKRNPEEIVYLVCAVNELANQFLEIYFSDGHTVDSFSSVFDKTKLNDLPILLDDKAIKSKYWKGADIDTDLKRRKEAEFLVEGDISPELIKYYICYNEGAKQNLLGFGIDENKIKIVPQAYY
ncbi:DUF4433 domain-containing protein [Capnocytophaga stomatis]|uniref:DUF4433 domain-containing protein n=1 Tax=Capnocytophaga stomatis TaxID=1848904 RepID=UPI00385BEEDE